MISKKKVLSFKSHYNITKPRSFSGVSVFPPVPLNAVVFEPLITTVKIITGLF